MSRFSCAKCDADLGGLSLAGRCKSCGAAYRATLLSRTILFGAIFGGFLFGPMVVRPFLVQQGVPPDSLVGTALPLMGGITAMLLLGGLSSRFLKYDWSQAR